MRVLVAVASKHGSTFGIGETIADELRILGYDVDERDVERVDSIEDYDAVVLGSAVYMGRWLGEARRFLAQHREALRERAVWLFSSGPLGDPPQPAGDHPELTEYAADLRARDTRTFAGSIAPETLSFRERLIVRAVHAPAGDFRDDAAIRDWAREIASALEPAPLPA